uniref:MD-2-related lipid-recognition domain-containing protein n=1 Tax=Anopheles farauti TaxID=69004 RepID=A0A182Q1X3_9DIPT
MIVHRCLVSLILFELFYSPASIAKIIPILDRVEATFDSKLSNSSFVLDPDKSHNQTRRYYPTFTLSFNTFRTVNEAWLHAKVLMATKKGLPNLPIFDSTVNFCDLLSHPQKYHLVSLVFYEIRRYGPVPKCPVPPGVYSYSKASLKQIQLPSFLSESDFVVEIEGFTGSAREKFCLLKLYGSLKRI